jgi:hypothetical protein
MVSNEIKKKFADDYILNDKKIYCKYFTNWSLCVFFILFTISEYVKLPRYIGELILFNVILSSIIGNYFTINYINNFSDYYKLEKKIFYISDLILHIIPLIFILYNYSNLLSNFHGKSNRFLTFINNLIIVCIYLLFIKNPQKYYPVPILELITLPLYIYFLVLFIFPKE